MLKSEAKKQNQLLLFIFPRYDMRLLKEISHGKRKKHDWEFKRILVIINGETEYNSICSMAKNPGIKGNDIIFSFKMSPNPIMKVFC